MDFFAAQDESRSRTKWLIVLYIFAVIGIIISLYALFVGIYTYSASGKDKAYGFVMQYGFWNAELFGWTALIVTCVIVGSSLFKISSLSTGGGAMVARGMAGYAIHKNTKDPDHKRYYNIVEEMSIASGVPMPGVYVLPDRTINAFAAGYTMNDAVVAVTEGCLKQLDRDELQGVVAHEFSHILNGDMRMNIRMMGVLFGILVIAVIGRVLMRGGAYTRGSGKDRKVDGRIMLLGFGIMCIGYIGVFFGRIIQAAVSRQREFLADASAVQFTRNPEGIGGALKRIGRHKSASHLMGAHVEETAHMFFANALSGGFLANIFATHPPIPARVLAIEPNWDGSYPKPRKSRTQESKPKKDTKKDLQQFATAAAAIAALKAQRQPKDVLLRSVGNVDQRTLNYAGQIRQELESQLGEYLESTLYSRAMLCLLLLDHDETIMNKQLSLIEECDSKLRAAVNEVWEKLSAIDLHHKIPLVDLLTGSYNELSKEEAESFVELCKGLVQADQSVSGFEFMVMRVLKQQLKARKGKANTLDKIVSGAVLRNPLSVALSVMARNSLPDDPDGQRELIRKAMSGKSKLIGASPLAPEQLNSDVLDQALDVLGRATPSVKKELLAACSDIMSDDGTISAKEAEMLRAFSVGINCPMPLILPSEQ